MSANTTKDFNLIQDEDVLKKMWQETEDFGRKKEIRSHMYKLREQRLKEFYNTNESTEIHRTTGKTCDTRTHADSLTDQSFLSLKSKEIRDSESPTRDSGFRIAERHNDHGWDVLSANEISMDGKTHTTIRQATTAGTQKIEGGKLDFAAKNEQVATVFQDGDDKNFTKSVGAKSNTMITQEAVGGDENSSFKASSTKVSSSSKVVTEHRSNHGETIPLATNDSVVRKVYTTDTPSDLKNHPSYMEGKTKVTQETRTLPDGTTVTTTRYETKGGTTSQSQTTSKYSATSKTSSEHSSSMKTSQVTQGGSTVVKQLRGTDEVDFVCEPRPSMQIVRSSDHQATDRSQKVHQEHHESVEEHRSSSHLTDKQARSEVHQRRLAEQQLLDKQTDVTSEKVHRTNETIQKSHTDHQQRTVNEKLQGTHTEQVIVDMVPVDNIEVTRVTKTRPSEHVTHITTATHDTKGTSDVKLSTDVAATTTKSTTYHHDTTRDQKHLTNEQFITTERQHEIDTRKPVEPTQARPEPQKAKQPPTEKPHYEQPEKRQPIQPPKSEWEQPPKTEGQYDTTYRTDYTNRKISVEVSPTHDAFARSLRAVSPERLPPHLVSPTHTTPLRSSTSPDKCRYPSRGSPERKSRSGSPRKSADRFSSTETITYSSRASPEKKTPTKYVNGIDIIRRRDEDTTTQRSTYESDTITKKKINTDTITRRTKPRSRSPSPISTAASEIEYFKNVSELVTDLDEVTDETVTRRTTERPSSLEITTRKTKKVTERSPTSPLKDVSPTKASPPRAASPQKSRTLPEDRIMKRTDTYEERCRQILGITETNERRRSSLERSSIKRSSFSKDSTMSPTEPPRKKSVESPRRTSFERRSPEKSPTKDKPFRPTEVATQPRRSPEKQMKTKSPSPTKEFPSQVRRSPEKKRPCAESPTKVQEFPSQTLRSPERQPLEPYPERKSPTKDVPSKLSEFPSQIRKSPVKEPLEPYPEKKKPCRGTPSNLEEFPSQARRYPEKEPLEPYPEKKRPCDDSPSKLKEFPSQLRKSPERQPLEPYPEKKRPCDDSPSKLREFPSQLRKSPERQPLEPYPEKKRPYEDSPSKVKEFPAQLRKSPERQPLEPYPDKKRPCDDSPSKLKEFPSQLRKSPERQPLEPYPEKKRPCDESPSKLKEFPSQLRKSPDRQPLEPYPEKQKPCEDSPSKLTEFPSQIRRSPEREGSPSQSRHSPERYSPSREVPCSLASIPSPTRKSPETSKPVKKGKKPKAKKPSGTSSSSSSSEDEEEITEEITRVTTTTYENSIPVKEPEVTKKFISQLCREDEVKHTDITKKTTEELLEQEILQNGIEAHPHKTVKKDLSRTSVKPKTKEFIDNERHTTTVKKTIDKVKDVKKDTITRTKKEGPKTPLKKQPEVHRTEKTKFVGETEYTDEYCKTRPKVQKTTEKITLMDLERSNKNQVDSKVHIRTHRIDDSVSKKTTTAVVTNGDICRKMKPKDTPKVPTATRTVTTVKRVPSPKVEDVKQKVTSQSRYTTTVKKTINVQDKPKPVEPKKLTPIKKIVDITKISSSRPEQTTTVKKHAVSSISVTTTKPKTTKPTKATPKGKVSKPTKLQNGHISSDTDEDVDSVEGSTLSLTKTSTTKDHVARVTKTREDQDTSTRTSRKPDKCITTKTLIINNKDEKREVIVDLQRSKSSREPTPDRLCPVPLSSDDESSVPRYPDEVEEPDDGSLRRKSKPTRLSDVPIIESEDIAEFTRFTEVKDTKKITEVDRVDQTDESLLSVNKKIHKFLDTAEKLTKEPLKVSGPAPKVERPKMEVVEDLKSDDCLLSVSDKVSKFISTAEQLITPSSIPERPKSPRCQNYPYEGTSKPKHSSDTTIEIEETIKDDDCLLSISEKVSKFISTADKLATSKQTVSLAKIDIKSTGRKSPERKIPDKKSPERKSPIRSTDTECVQIETEEDMYTRRSSPTRSTPSPDEKTPTRRPSNQYKEILKTGMSSTRRSSSPKLPDSTPKSAKEEPKPVLSGTERLRSTESIKRAKALFENISKEKDSAWTKDILSRPSVFEGRKSNVEERRSSLKKKLSYSEESTREENCSRYDRRSKSPEKDRPRSTSPQKEQPCAKEPDVRESPEHGDVPHYMLPLDRSLRPNSPHRESLAQGHPERPIEEPEPHTTKFNVTLKRTDSGKAAKSSTTERRKSSITLEKRITEEEIEEIFELEVLEELLEKVIGYDLRRKIRTQIRLVKKLISENTLESYIAKLKNSRRDSISKTSRTEHVRKSSPERRTVDHTKSYQHTSLTAEKDHTQKSQSEYTSNYSYHSERRTSSEFTRKTTSRSQSPEVQPLRAPSPQKQTPSSRRSPEKEPKSRVSPDRKSKTETTKTFTQLKKSAPTSKPVEDDKPEWVKSRNLRKTSETAAPVVKKTTTTTTKTTKKETVRSTSPVKEVKTTDLITSSYGVGPTDENGTPLFGLRALRAQNKNDVTKVQGTVVTSEYYSENGEDPVGQISVTKYSTDPKDLGTGDQVSSTNKGLTSVTTTQKFGYKDTPSLKSLTTKKKEIKSTEETRTKSNKTTRRNSVKEISQKFIDNAVDILKSERQTSYPKAGLILRTSSFKDSRTGDSRQTRRDSSDKEDFESTVTVKTTKSRTEGGETTFLTNKSRVTGVQDVIDRMKTEEYREGDTAEDAEARSLLNKFIGSQVILSGMESRAMTSSTSTKGAITSDSGSGVKRTSKITITVTEGGKPVTKTRVFQHPITEEDLEHIWHEQTLRLLLEQSLDYEERRAIRARLRQVMAEQEACADLVEKATSLSQAGEQQSDQQSVGALDGESLLLPLLQGLLDAPDKEQLAADSGTESGEDQRGGLIAEVQNALEKLSFSLRDDSTDISPERRASLLQLVTKLQAGLATTTPKLERRLSSGPTRFRGRRGRQNRHTVGVSSEELADARKLMEQISLHELTPSTSENKVIRDLQKQNSESSVTSSSSYSKLGAKGPVKNATAKPFSSPSNSISNASSVAQTPTEHTPEQFEAAFGPPPESSELLEDAEGIRTAHKAVQQAAARKKGTSESETEDDSSTVKGLTVESSSIGSAPSPQQVNPIYSRPLDNSERPRSPSYEEKVSRFNTMSKKNKMKRANTIDIPKALLIYTDEDDSEYSEDEEQRRKNNYYALRGPIRVHNPVSKNPMPVLQPKTESDQKFLAFINKNNPNLENKTTPWVHTNKTSMWGNRFGNIKNKYENEPDRVPENAAKNFWKTQDDTVRTSNLIHGPKISRKSARNLQQMYEEKQRKKQENDQHVVTGSLTLKTEPERNYKLVPQPVPYNNFSHGAQSAFVALPKKVQTPTESTPKEIIKTELKDSRDHLYLYSPKPIQGQSQNSSTASSPVITSKPWIANAVEHGGRVLSMAAKKFETPPQQDAFPAKPRKLSKEINKAFVPQQTPPEKLTAPYIVKSTDQKNSTVRKLSDQYDNMGNKIEDKQQQKTHYVPPHRVPQTMDQNIQYTTKVTQSFIPNVPEPQSYYEQRPKENVRRTQSEKYQPFNVSDYAPVNYSITYDKPKPQPQPQPVHNYSKVEPKPQPVHNYHNSEPKPQPIFQHVPGKEDPQEQSYTSSFQFNINSKNPNQVPVQVIEPVVQPRRLEKQLSTESIHEYTAISSKVMKGPVSQQAVTVRQKSPMNRDQHDMVAAFQLKSALQKVGKSETSPPNKSPRNSVQYPSKPIVSPNNSFKYTAIVANSQTPSNSYKPTDNMSRDVQSRYKAGEDQRGFNKYYDPSEAPKPTVPVKSIKSKFEENCKMYGVVKPMQQQKPLGPIYNNVAPKPQTLITSDNRQGVVTSKFHIPVINVAPSSPLPSQAQVLSKSDSWHQICMANQVDGSPRSCSARAIVKSKSSHNLAVPKGQFEAGITKEELQQKKKTIEAYFSGNKSPEPQEKVVKRSINRIKTSEKRSAYRQGSGVVRSKTLPDIVCPELLDESNIDAAFEDLVKSSV